MKLAAALQERFASWALRVRPPEAVPVVLGQRRVYVLPTRAGLLYALALLVMLLGAINYNLNLGYGLVFLLAGLGIVAILHTFRNLVGLAIVPGRADPVFAGESARFTLVLHNSRQEERRLIQLKFKHGGKDSIDIPPGAATEARLNLPAPRRGWLTLPRVTIETTYPLGLVRAWSYAQPGMRCLVYPRPAALAPVLPTSGGHSGGRRQSQRGNEDFAGLRGHQPADPPRHIAWKTAARQGADAPWQTKQFSGTGARVLWLDWDETPLAADAETRLAVLARWVVDAAASGLVWGLRLPGTGLPPASGDSHLHACLKALALHDA